MGSGSRQPIDELAGQFIQADIAKAAAGPAIEAASRASKRVPIVPLPTPTHAPRALGSTRTLWRLGTVVVVILLVALVLGGPKLLTFGPDATPDPNATKAVATAMSTGIASPTPTDASTPTAVQTLGPIETTGPGSTDAPPPSAPPTIAPAPSTKPTAAPTSQPTPKPTAKATATPVVVFIVTPKGAAGACKSGLAPFKLLLDNTGSNRPVSWSIDFALSVYPGDWGSANPPKGTVPAGEATVVTITPQDVCPVLKSVTDFSLVVLHGAGGSVPFTYTVTP